MPDFFKVLRAEPPGADPWAILSRLVTALLLGVVAVVTEVIGDNVTRAFSLVGALFLIRFRAAVRETQPSSSSRSSPGSPNTSSLFSVGQEDKAKRWDSALQGTELKGFANRIAVAAVGRE